MKSSLSTVLLDITNQRLHACLLYGPHTGLIHGILQELACHLPCRFVSEEEFLETAPFLFSPSLFSSLEDNGNHQIFIIENVDDKKKKRYENILTTIPQGICVILTASTLTSTSSLVRFMTVGRTWGTVSCYECSWEESQKIWARCWKKYGFSLSPDLEEICIERTRYGGWVHGAEALALYLHGGTTHNLTPQDVKDLLPMKAQDLQWPSILSPELGAISRAFFDTQGDNVEDILKNIRGWQRQLLQAIHLKFLMTTNGLSSQVAVSQMTPPIFFKHVSLMTDLCQKKSYNRIKQTLHDLYLGEVQLKSGVPWIILQGHLWQTFQRLHMPAKDHRHAIV